MSPEDYVIAVECVSGEFVCLATRNGDIVFYNIQTRHVESVGSVEGGLLGMTWSPDQELAVFSTATGSLLLMTHTLDPSGDSGSDLVPVTEVPMCPAEFGRAEPVTVGWGRKSTQFHGSAGKQSAREMLVQESGSAHPWDDLRPRVSWPEEGEYFACSCIDPASGGRRFRVWTREGELFSTGEVTQGLEQCLHWRPSGGLIASSQSLPHTHQVVFFEKNGLRRGEFSLPPHPSWQDGKCVVQELCWNCDSTVLCLWLEERKTPTSHPLQSSIQLWVRGNYHWYLKQELFSPLTPDSALSASLQAVQWDPVVPLRLHIITSDGCYVCCDWRWRVNKSSCLTRDNLCDVAVIDGDRLFLTPFRHVTTPPPMRTHTLSLPSPILTISHAPPPLVNDFLVVTATAEVAVFSYSQSDTQRKTPFPLPSPKLVGLARLPVATSLVRQLTWQGAESLVGVVWDAASGRDSVMEFQLIVDHERGRVKVEKRCSHSVPPPHSSIISLSSHPHSGSTVAQATDGTLFCHSPSEGLLPWKLPSGLALKFPEGTCDHVSVATFHDKEHVVGLNEFRRTLYVDDCKVATGATTFDLHNEFLIYTTDSHECHFLRTSSISVVATSDPSDRPNLVEEGKRRVERGSKIVVVVPHDSKLVLQMPRGNLETIYPRPLVLSKVRRHLDNRCYGDAFLAMRTNRINLNLIYDHNPQVYAVKCHACLRISQLKNSSSVGISGECKGICRAAGFRGPH
ncbi:Elongator complex protein 1 [Geodia barretti]|uniref:Elongator complex protein 1 n=1 Tax=Geodia barretti TaxID=519541 RepID=A0AA35R137_GEOBA|nr:Elongator complex protein 1 [Geodia barretti]